MQGKDTLHDRRLWLDTRSSSSNLGPICTCLVAHCKDRLCVCDEFVTFGVVRFSNLG
jgi:hypothetical protein